MRAWPAQWAVRCWCHRRELKETYRAPEIEQAEVTRLFADAGLEPDAVVSTITTSIARSAKNAVARRDLGQATGRPGVPGNFFVAASATRSLHLHRALLVLRTA